MFFHFLYSFFLLLLVQIINKQTNKQNESYVSMCHEHTVNTDTNVRHWMAPKQVLYYPDNKSTCSINKQRPVNTVGKILILVLFFVYSDMIQCVLSAIDCIINRQQALVWGLAFWSLEFCITDVAVLVFRSQNWPYLDKRAKLGRFWFDLIINSI